MTLAMAVWVVVLVRENKNLRALTWAEELIAVRRGRWSDMAC
jgi:hypothetical protein